MELFCGDCLEMMGKIPAGTVDLVLTDPPYSSGGLFAGDRKAATRDKFTQTDHNGASMFPSFSGDNMDQRSFTLFMRINRLSAKGTDEVMKQVVPNTKIFVILSTGSRQTTEPVEEIGGAV